MSRRHDFMISPSLRMAIMEYGSNDFRDDLLVSISMLHACNINFFRLYYCCMSRARECQNFPRS